MAHRGKHYPFYNPAKAICHLECWPNWPGTEYRFTLEGILGPATPPNFLEGRGLLPVPSGSTASSRIYRGNVTTYLSLPIDLELTISFDNLVTGNYFSFALFWGGVKFGELADRVDAYYDYASMATPSIPT